MAFKLPLSPFKKDDKKRISDGPHTPYVDEKGDQYGFSKESKKLDKVTPPTQAEKQEESETTRKGKRMLDYQPQTQKKKNGGYSYQDFLDL
tara:strand:+ start:501 stop:773 length:273 start_codon:yes stop_codon:yes gene_type:complete